MPELAGPWADAAGFCSGSQTPGVPVWRSDNQPSVSFLPGVGGGEGRPWVCPLEPNPLAVSQVLTLC